jgi:hypothetical protein
MPYVICASCQLTTYSAALTRRRRSAPAAERWLLSPARRVSRLPPDGCSTTAECGQRRFAAISDREGLALAARYAERHALA